MNRQICRSNCRLSCLALALAAGKGESITVASGRRRQSDQPYMEVKIVGRRFSLLRVALLPAVLSGLILSVTMAVQPALATSSPQILNQGASNVENRAMCLDMTGGSVSNGAQPQLWTCNGNRQQNWTLIALPNGYYLIENDNSAKCLSILDNNPNAGATVIQYNCNFSGNDNFENWHLLLCTSADRCHIQNEGNDFYMRPSGCGTTNGTRMYLNGPCFINATDVWDLVHVL